MKKSAEKTIVSDETIPSLYTDGILRATLESGTVKLLLSLQEYEDTDHADASQIQMIMSNDIFIHTIECMNLIVREMIDRKIMSKDEIESIKSDSINTLEYHESTMD